MNDSSRGPAAVGISGSPSSSSKSRMLVEYALARLAARGAVTELVDLATLPADALLGRAAAPALIAALETATRAQIIVAGTPVYRATYSGLLKVFFDLLPQDSLIGKVGVPIVTGHGAAHSLSVDHGMHPGHDRFLSDVIQRSGECGQGDRQVKQHVRSFRYGEFREGSRARRRGLQS